jgi:hypothetical protein
LVLGVVAVTCLIVWMVPPGGEGPRAAAPEAVPEEAAQALGVRQEVVQPDREAKTCTVRLRTVDLDGVPLPGIEVRFALSPGRRRPVHWSGPDGLVEVAGVPCGSSGSAFVGNEWHVPNRAELSFVDVLKGRVVELRVDPGLAMRLQVVDPAGQPIEGAHLNGLPTVFTDARGRVTVQVPSREPAGVLVSAYGHGSGMLEFDPLGPDADQTQVLVLDYARHIRVDFVPEVPEHGFGDRLFCSARDQQASLRSCTTWPRDAPARGGETLAGATVCACPVGEALVFGEGIEVPVEPEDTVVEVDLTPELEVTGRLVLEGAPVRGWVDFRPVVDDGPVSGASELLGGPTAHTDSAGRFSTGRLSAGRWDLTGWTGEGSSRLGIVTIPDDVATLDLGDLELGGKGGIEGPCPAGGDMLQVPLMVHALPVGGGVSPRQLSDGCFGRPTWLLDGLKPGLWRVWESHDPGAVVEVEVEAGVIHDGVVFEHGDELHQPTLGFTVRYDMPDSRDDLERLGVGVEVVEVTPGSPADLAGLRAGMEVVAVHSPHLSAEAAAEAPEGASVFALLEADHTAVRIDVRGKGGRVESIELP